jgi:hypothetical protein
MYDTSVLGNPANPAELPDALPPSRRNPGEMYNREPTWNRGSTNQPKVDNAVVLKDPHPFPLPKDRP